MTRWALGTAALGITLNLGGWALVSVSGQIGGLMVYASIPILLGAVLFILALVGMRLLLRTTRST